MSLETIVGSSEREREREVSVSFKSAVPSAQWLDVDELYKVEKYVQAVHSAHQPPV